MALAAHHRKVKKKTKLKKFELIEHPISFQALRHLSNAKMSRDRKGLTLGIGFVDANKHLKNEVYNVIETLGGVRSTLSEYTFDYDISDVLHEVLTNGTIPDYKSHQFYPTPERLANEVISLAKIDEDHTVLEPSAGQGGLASLITDGKVSCVEISPTNCMILKSKELNTICADFMTWKGGKYDRVVMNPPFSEGRAKHHVMKAAEHVNDNGILVAVLPSSAKRNIELDGFNVSWSDEYKNEFAGASVTVVIMVAEKA